MTLFSIIDWFRAGDAYDIQEVCTEFYYRLFLSLSLITIFTAILF